MKRALLIGINNYPDQKTLFGCLNDVAAMEQILREQFEFSDIEALTEAAATRQGIQAGIERLVGRTEAGDIVLFYYAGHGSQIFADNSGEGDFFDETIVPWDSVHAGERPNTDILDNELNEWLVKGLTNKTDNVTLIFDSCHSKSISRDSSGGRTRNAERDVRPPSVHHNPGVAGRSGPGPGTRSAARSRSGWLPTNDSYVLMAGCRDEELSGEMEVETGGETIHHGAFTYYLAQELKNMAPGTAYRIVFERAAAKVAIQQAGQQHPQIEGRLDHVIFGDKAVTQMQYVRALPVEGMPEQVKLETGAAMGARVGAVWALYPQGTTAIDETTPKLGEVTIGQVGAVESLAEWRLEAGQTAPTLEDIGGWAVLVSQNWGEMALRVAVVAEEAEAEALKSAVLEREADLVRFVDPGQNPTMTIKVVPARTEMTEDAPVPELGPVVQQPLWAVLQDGHLAVPIKQVGDGEAFKEIAKNLRKAAVYLNAIQLSNPTSPLVEQIDFELRFWDGAEWQAAEPNDGGEIVLTEGKPNYIQMVVSNNGEVPVYIHILDFGLNWEIASWFPDPPSNEGEMLDTDAMVEIPDKGNWWYTIPQGYPLLPMAGPVEGRVTFKMFVTTKPADFSWLKQTAVRGERSLEQMSPLERLMARAVAGTRGKGSEPEPLAEAEWTTIERSIVVRKGSG